MPFPMKIQPIDFNTLEEVVPPRLDTVKPVVKSRLKRLFERQFPSVLRNSASEKVGGAAGGDELPLNKECTAGAEFEPSSVCLAKMVQNFIEENNEKQQSGAVRCSRNRCNWFNRSCTDSSEDEMDGLGFGDSNLTSAGEASEILRSLVSCESVSERNLLADTARIVEKNKICKRKDDLCRKIVTDGLLALGYDASICKSRWEKSSSCPAGSFSLQSYKIVYLLPLKKKLGSILNFSDYGYIYRHIVIVRFEQAGEYEYIDVIIEGERLLIDIDFRSEFEIARSTKTYKTILQILPFIFVGRADRLQKIIAIVSEAVKQSLKKKEMHIPPWRKAEYVKAKWLSPHKRATPLPSPTPTPTSTIGTLTEFEFETKATEKGQPLFELNPDEKINSVEDAELGESIFALSESSAEEEGKERVEKEEWKPPEIKPKNSQIGVKMVTGLASVIEDEPRKF
ncbi:hypothetical protein PTKIN_Ptkin12aG0077400 [Pterospermum kingtungense]